jgi:hypothetical protein
MTKLLGFWFLITQGEQLPTISLATRLRCQSESSQDEASRLLRKLLDARGEFVREQIRQAHQKLMDVRASFPDAGALAACIDQTHAVMVAEVIREVTGCDPSVIVSDSEVENDTVRSFRNSKKEWLVAGKKGQRGN